MRAAKASRVPDILYIIFSSLGALFWLGFLLFSWLFGGVTGPPDFERSVSYSHLGLMAFGLAGATLGIVAGAKGLGGKYGTKALPLCAAALHAAGTAPLFLMDLAEVGMIVLALGLLPALLYLILTRKRQK